MVFPLSEYRRDCEFSTKVTKLVATGNYDSVVVRYFQLAMRAGVLDFGLPVYLDMDDYEPQRFVTRANVSKSWFKRICWSRSASNLRHFFKRISQNFQAFGLLTQMIFHGKDLVMRHGCLTSPFYRE